MFYISRRIEKYKFGVIDTSDGVEDVMTFNEIEKAIKTLGVEIKGVDFDYSRGCINRITVYQNEKDLRASQVKLRVLKGITIKLMGSEIVGIKWDNPPIVNKVSLRLSDYGSSCGRYLFSEARNPEGLREWFTLILDDKLDFKSTSFRDDFGVAPCVNYGIVFDIRELTKTKLVRCLYQDIIESQGAGPLTLEKFILDDKERQNYWKAVAVLYNGFESFLNCSHIGEVVFDAETVRQQIDKRCVKEFLAFTDYEFKMRWPEITDKGRQFLARFSTPGYQRLRRSKDFDEISGCLVSMLSLLMPNTTCNQKVLIRYINYLRHFTVNTEVRKASVEFYHRGLTWFMDFARGKGIIR